MKKFVLALLFGSTAFAMAGKYEPVYTGTVTIGGDHTMAKIETAIKKALVNRGWGIVSGERGNIKAKIILRGHTAVIDIQFDKKKVTFNYVSSMELGYREKGGQKLIHRNYNRWILNLERDVQVFLLE